MRAGQVRKTEPNKKVTYLPGARQFRPAGSRLMSGLIILLVLYFVLLFATQYVRLLQLRSTLRIIEEDIQVVRLQNEEMLREIEKLHSPAYLEEIAREELGMVRSGELLFLFRKQDNQ